MIFLRKYKTYTRYYNILQRIVSLNHKIVINDVSMAGIETVTYNSSIKLVTKYTYENYDEWEQFNIYIFHIKSPGPARIIPTLKIKINEVSQYYNKQYTDDHLVLRNGTINVAIRSINIDTTQKRLKNLIKIICKKKNTTSLPLTHLYVNGKFRNTLWARLGF